MARIDYLFILRSEGCDAEVHRCEMDTPEGYVTVVGVPTVDEACRVAAQARHEGTAAFVELCGDFGEDGCRRVIDAVGGALPVGYVTYLPAERVKIDRLFDEAG